MENIKEIRFKKLELLIKNYIIKKYGVFIPKEKIQKLMESDFVNEKIINDEKTDIENNGELLRSILASVIDVTCIKNLEINENVFKDIKYGDFLQKGLIEYYAKIISTEYKIDINEIPELKENLEFVIELKKRLKNGLDPLVFKKNAIEILNEANYEELIKKCDEDAIKNYEEKEDIKEEIEENKQLQNQEKIQLVYLNGEQYVKYTDQYNEIHLIKSDDPEKTSTIYKNALAKNDELDAKKLFEEFKIYFEEIEFTEDKDINEKNMEKDTKEQIEYTRLNSDVQDKLENENPLNYGIQHSKDGDLHIVNDDIVTTKIEDEEISGKIIDKNNTQYSNDGSYNASQNNIVLDDGAVLSPEDYEKLCTKFVNGEELTGEELEALVRSTPRNIEIYEVFKEALDETREREKGPVLIPKTYNSHNTDAFINNSALLTILTCLAIAGFIVGFTLFKILN